MFALKRVSTPLLLVAAAQAALAHAETQKGPEPQKGDVAAEQVSQRAAPPGVIVPLNDPDEIVVTAARRGEAKVAAETEFAEDEIAAQGADSIQDLLARLAPFIDGSGEEPVILINGKPVGFDRSILSYPAEALDRLAVLKPEAAAQYGEPAGKRVVNLVLKKSFSTLNVDAGADFATAGGQYSGTLSVGRTAIEGDTRWNAQARIGGDSAFRKTARNIPPRDGIFDSVGFVSAPGGGEIDPALSLAAGRLVTAAGIPIGALNGMPDLDDFAATADALHPVDPNRFETLQSARRSASFGIGVTRPLGDFSASLNLNATRNSSEGERGLPMASLVIPAGHPWSPFADDVVLTRPFAGERPLRNDNSSTALSGSLTVNGAIDGWQTSLAVSYSRIRAVNFFENGVDVARVQQRIDAADPGFNPYGVWDEGLMIATRGRTKGENLNARLNVSKAIFDLPAGPLTWNLTASAGRNSTQSQQSDALGNPATAHNITRSQSSGQTSLSIPISRRGEGGIGFLGDLSADLNASVQTMTNSRAQKRFGSNISWSPSPIIQLRGSIDYAQTAPSFDELDAPIVTTVTRIFDYARQEVAEPVWITGGNPDLAGGSRQNLSLGALVRPLGSQLLTVNVGYRQSVAKGGLASFPELTPAIEAAFPERVTRDAEGRLVMVDARPINIARDTDTSLSSGVALRLGPARRRERGAAPGDPLQLSIALNHSWRLKSELLTRPGIPAIDQLADSGQSRHSLSLQITAGKRGIGANVNGNWSSASTVSNADRLFRFKPPLTFNLSMFVEPGRLAKQSSPGGLTKDLKISFDIQNVFNGYRRITLDDGSIPPGYTRDEIDPLGRTVRINVRKRF